MDAPSREIYTLSLHDALPIFGLEDRSVRGHRDRAGDRRFAASAPTADLDRKSTRLNSSHLVISYAVFCLKKKNQEILMEHNPLEARPIDSHDIERERGITLCT